MKFRLILFAGLLLSLVMGPSVRAQVVGVTAQLDTNTITVGQGTTLRIFAQVLPAYRPVSSQIFSWYVDVLNSNGPVAAANYGALVKPVSDNDPLISSNGFTSGANRRAVYDTFLNLANAGVTNRVELMRIPVTGLAAGQTRFSVQAGTGQPSLDEDFIVAPRDGGEYMSGGEYSGAFANLTVLPGTTPGTITCLTIAHTNIGGGQQRVTLTFCPASGHDHFVDFRAQVEGGAAGWQAAPGGPYNSGVYVQTNSVAMRYYRIRAQPR